MRERGIILSASEQIISKQIEWAKNKGLQLVGSAGQRGRKVYTTTTADNLFKTLNKETKKELEAGDGRELNGKTDRPAKIQALHSSSALAINVFDYWRESTDISPITASCGLSRADRELAGEIQFEKKLSIDNRFQYSPNLDVVILPQSGRYIVYAIECKLTEAYSSRAHGGLDHKYLTNEDVWQNLSETQRLAKKLSPNDNLFRHLHAAQLIKHILGLNRRFGHSRYRFLYLWYDALGEPGYVHRKEVEEFADVVRSDGVVFHETTYQDVIICLGKYREGHGDYVKYLTSRYL